jgi:lysophospholipase L1-like esterase
MLGAMLRDARAAGIRVFLVTSPTWRREGGLDPRQPPLIERIETIAHAEGIPWLRVTADTHPEFAAPDLFADGTHLNEVGAARFSGIVADWIAGLDAPTPALP